MSDRAQIEVYEWPEGEDRSTKVALEFIESDKTAPIPSVGDVLLIPAPPQAIDDDTVDEDEYFIMRGFGKPYRVVGRELMYSVRSRDGDGSTPLHFGKVWIFVRAMTKDDYWSGQP